MAFFESRGPFEIESKIIPTKNSIKEVWLLTMQAIPLVSQQTIPNMANIAIGQPNELPQFIVELLFHTSS